MTNRVERFDKDGNIVETYDYEERFSAMYTLQLVWCYVHKVNIYNKKQREKAKAEFIINESSVSFCHDGDTYVCTKQAERKDINDGINSSALDF